MKSIQVARVPLLASFYLILPVIVFWLCYVGTVYGFSIGVSLLAGSILLVRWQLNEPVEMEIESGWPVRWIAILGATFIILIMGFFADTYAWDWYKHWALLGVLTKEPWPVHITLDGDIYQLRFYIAAYIIPALVSSKLGIPLNWAVGIWFWIGSYLCLRLLLESSGFFFMKSPVSRKRFIMLLVPLLFFMSGGLDGLLTWMEHGYILLGLHTEWWAPQLVGYNWQYTSPLAAMAWVPHQAIAVFILVGLLLRQNSLYASMIAYTSLSMWSPLAMVGLFPLVVTKLIQDRVSWLGLDKRAQVQMISLLMALPVVAAIIYLSRGMSSAVISGGQFTILELASRVWPDLIFIAFELFLVWGCLGRKVWNNLIYRVSLITLLVIPFVSSGNPPDFVMRASLGPLAILLFAATRELVQRLYQGKWFIKIISLLSFALVLPTSINEIVFHLNAGEAYFHSEHQDLADDSFIFGNFISGHNITVSEFLDVCGWSYIPQYFVHDPQ